MGTYEQNLNPQLHYSIQMLTSTLIPTNLTNNGPPKLIQSSPRPWFAAPNLGWSSSLLRVFLLPRSLSFHLQGMLRWPTPQASMQRNSQRLGKPTVPLLGGLACQGHLGLHVGRHYCYWILMGFYGSLPIGKLQRQRFGEKGKRSFIQKLHNLGRMAGFCLSASPL